MAERRPRPGNFCQSFLSVREERGGVGWREKGGGGGWVGGGKGRRGEEGGHLETCQKCSGVLLNDKDLCQKMGLFFCVFDGINPKI
jgi:hypothetical protein